METHGQPRTHDWRPSKSEALAWNAAAALLLVLGLVLFGLPVFARAGHPGGRVTISLVSLAAVLAAVTALACLHEGVHALVMRVVGARPSFGVTIVAGAFPALYTTAPGHVFSRRQYLGVTVAPGVALSALGFLACFSSFGGYLVIPLAVHLAGCVGDAAATQQLLRQPAGTRCEDLRDGIRFHSPI
jgi:hypothetical protein